MSQSEIEMLAREERADENRRRDREDSSPRQQQIFHAQILSTAA